jgi:hypothetical protein
MQKKNKNLVLKEKIDKKKPLKKVNNIKKDQNNTKIVNFKRKNSFLYKRILKSFNNKHKIGVAKNLLTGIEKK